MAVKVSNKKPRGTLDLYSGMGNTPQQNNAVIKSTMKAAPPWQASAGVAGGALGLGAIGDLFGGLFGGGQQGAPKSAAPKKPHKVAPPQAPAAPTPQQQQSFADYLNAAAQMLGPQAANAPGDPTGGVDFAGLQAQTTQAANDNSSKLRALYDALGQNYMADAPAIQQNFDSGINSVNAANQGASQNVNNAYDQARAAQTAQLQALGIGDAAGVIAGKGESSTADQAAAISNLAQSANAVNNQLATNKTAALDYNTKIAQAAPQEGVDKSALIQQKLQQDLATIRAQQMQAEQQAAQQSQSSQSGYLNELLGLANGMAGFDTKQSAQSDNNALNALKQQLAQQKFDASQRQSGLSPAAQANMYSSILKTVGGDPKKAADILSQYLAANK